MILSVVITCLCIMAVEEGQGRVDGCCHNFAIQSSLHIIIINYHTISSLLSSASPPIHLPSILTIANNNNQSNMKLSILLFGSVSIAIVSAQDIAFGTNKTLAPTPGVIRPNAPPVPPPITPFPTEPNVVSIYFNFMICSDVVGSEWVSVYHGYITNSQFMISCRCIDTTYCNTCPSLFTYTSSPLLISIHRLYHIFIRHHHQLHRHSFQHPQHQS